MTTFIAQLNQLFASSNEDGWLAGLCDLLRTHTNAHVRLSTRNGRLIAEALPHDGTRPSNNAYILPLPILAGESNLASLVLSRESTPFDNTDEHMVSIAVSIFTILLRQREKSLYSLRSRRLEAVRSAINALSFSELEAVIHIIQALNGSEGRLIAGHVADKLGFTRSVVVNALKKLESAGVMEARSLGVKGTHIRIKDLMLVEELSKLGTGVGKQE